jgi:hypothetical protein
MYQGTSFYKVFKKGEDKDYDWKTFMGSSELNQTDHLQLEMKVRSNLISPIPESSNQFFFTTDILMQIMLHGLQNQ